jgi:hypothetical protein
LGIRFFTFTHQLTLLPYALISCAVQLALFCAWYAQLANHPYLLERSDREAARGKRMSQYGWIRCLKSVFRDNDEAEVPLPADAQRLECVCGCCWLFSTSCTLWCFNLTTLMGLTYLLLIGSGTLESTGRFSQVPECRVGMPAGYYIYAMTAALLLLYFVLLIVRIMCSARNVVQGVVQLGKHIQNRVQTRRAFRKPNGGLPAHFTSTYAKLDAKGRPVDAELGLELSDDERMDEGIEHLELDMQDLHDELDLQDAQPLQLQHPRPQRAVGQLAASPPATAHAPNGRQAQNHSFASPPDDASLDPDEREMLEMLGMRDGEAADDASTTHQRQAEEALDRMEAQMLP